MKKRVDYRAIFTYILTLYFILLAIFRYKFCFIRIKETIRDIFQSFKVYYLTLIKGEVGLTSSIINKSVLDIKEVIPIDFKEFKRRFGIFKFLFVDKTNVINYIKRLSNVSLVLTLVLTFFIVLLIFLKMIFDVSLKKVNNDYGEDTKALKRFKKIENLIRPIISVLKDLIRYCFQSRLKGLWLLIWLYNLNVFSIIGETVAYLYYFIVSFDVEHLYIQLYKLLIDISIMLSALPICVWIIIATRLIVVYRKGKAEKVLRHNESKNIGFAKSLGIATMFTSPMNGGKTKMVTDLSLCFVSVFKSDALKTMQKTDMEFSHFPFIKLEKHIENLVARHIIYSLASIENYFSWKRKYFEYCEKNFKKIWCSTPQSILYGYDYERYGLYYDNGLYRKNIFEDIIIYAKAYFIYSMPDSFIVSNYAIREDGVLETVGNFPIWDYDYFNRSSETVDELSYYSKILDFDVLRKGKKVQENNPLADTFEFGVVAITEFDKDRGNTLDTKELKKQVEETNQKNDLFNYSPKMARHSATIDYSPYVRYLFDLQRAMKTEADLREICDCIIEVGDIEKGKLAMPFFFIEEILYSFVLKKFTEFYNIYRFYHGNNTLYMYLLKKISSSFLNYYYRIYNLYGYDVQRLKISNGKMDGKLKRHKYYESYMKVHANRYSTDCYSGYFKEGVLKKGKGITDYTAYKSCLASRDELRKQNSYFIRDLENAINNK